MKQTTCILKKYLLIFYSCFYLIQTPAHAATSTTQQIQQLLQNAQQLMSEQHYEEAADLLEKILLLDAETPGIATLYQHALEQIDQHLRGYSNNVISKNQWYTGGRLQTLVGIGTNLNRAPTDKNITLTLPDSDLILELITERQPKKGYGVETSLGLYATNQWQSQQALNANLQIDYRYTNQQEFTDYLHINTGLELQHNLDDEQQLIASVMLDALEYDTEERFYVVDLMARYNGNKTAQCQPQIGLDLQWQHQRQNSLFDKLYPALLLATRCQWAGSYYDLQINTGHEWALDSRPGGHQWRLRTQLAHTRELNWLTEGDIIRNSIGFDYRHDQHGYSQFLANNSPRRTQRLILNTQYRLPLRRNTTQWWGIFKVNWQKQNSNLKLFQFEDFEFWTGIEVIW